MHGSGATRATSLPRRPRRSTSTPLFFKCIPLLLLPIILQFRSVLRTSSPSRPPHSASGAGPPVVGSGGAAPPKGISGCLLIKDDNDRLSEWIAYHALTLPMRFLIVAVDPDARQSPRDVLDAYVSAGVLSGAELWEDEGQYCPACAARLAEGADESALEKHERRQIHFIKNCVKRHREAGRTWTALIDTDEFLTFNRIPADKRKWTEEKRRGALRRERKIPFNEYGEMMPKVCVNDTAEEYTDIPRTPRTALPPPESDATLYDFIMEHARELPFASPCVNVPRLFFGSLESDPSEVSAGAPPPSALPLGSRALSTLRFRHHAVKGQWDWNRYSKALVDASRINLQGDRGAVANPHRTFHDFCPYAMPCYHRALFRVQHYLGSYESYASRTNYVLRTTEKYALLANRDQGEDDDIRPWVSRFVRKHGPAVASSLLAAGGVADGGSGPAILFSQAEAKAKKKVNGRNARTAVEGAAADDGSTVADGVAAAKEGKGFGFKNSEIILLTQAEMTAKKKVTRKSAKNRAGVRGVGGAAADDGSAAWEGANGAATAAKKGQRDNKKNSKNMAEEVLDEWAAVKAEALTWFAELQEKGNTATVEGETVAAARSGSTDGESTAQEGVATNGTGAKKAGWTFLGDVAVAKKRARDNLLAAKARQAKAAEEAATRYSELSEEEKAAAAAAIAKGNRQKEIMAKKVAAEWAGLKAEALAWFAARHPAGKAESLA